MRFTHLSIALSAAALALSAPVFAAPRGDEPVAVPRTVKQGIDFVYVDPELGNVAKRHQRPQNWLLRALSLDFTRRGQPHPIFSDLARGLDTYRSTWGRLPQNRIAGGATLKPGARGARVAQLRRRLGLAPGGSYDQQVAQAVRSYQFVHGLTPVDGIAGRQTIASLNLGADHYAKRIAINMERAWRLPATGQFNRYVLVDSGAAEVYLFDRDRRVDGMRAIVGTRDTPTPMMAVTMRNAKANPYWNVPPELIQSFTAKRVLQDGTSYLRDFHYEVLSDWGPNARIVDPKTIDWRKVARSGSDIRVRQLPGPWNSMGEMKFEMPNDYGIYLHDTPKKEVFAKDDRWISNGCVRLEDYRRFSAWVFGQPPRTAGQREEVIDLPRPVPVFMTYLTVAPAGQGVVFRPDPYGFDRLAMPQMFGGRTASAS